MNNALQNCITLKITLSYQHSAKSQTYADVSFVKTRQKNRPGLK